MPFMMFLWRCALAAGAIALAGAFFYCLEVSPALTLSHDGIFLQENKRLQKVKQREHKTKVEGGEEEEEDDGPMHRLANSLSSYE